MLFWHVHRSSRLDRQVLPVNIACAAAHQGEEGHFVGWLAICSVALNEKSGQIPIIEQADAQCRMQQDAAFIVEIDGLDGAGRLTGVADEGIIDTAKHPRGIGQADKNPLRPILQKSAA